MSLTQDEWVQTTPASTVTEQSVRSQSGRIVQNTLADTTAAAVETSTYKFDAAGRLTLATIPGHTLSYGFDTATCGVATAGMNGNRTSSSDAQTTGSTTVTTATSYCYDNADRLTGTSTTGAPAGASPVAAGTLSTTGPGATLAYDLHGNTTKLADQTLGYDVNDGHVSTSFTDGSKVEYLRDAGGNIVSRTVTPATGSTDPVKEFRYTGGAVLDGTGAVLQRSIGLPGGVALNLPAVGTQQWAYPNGHGDVIITANEAGVRQPLAPGSAYTRASYDPFGQSIDPVTGNIGTVAADDAVPDTLPGDADYSWVGKHSKLYEHQGSLATIEMGERQYVLGLGRFLEVDPVEGGVTNAYDYPADPVNKLDLTGKFVPLMIFAIVAIALVVLSIPSSTQQKRKPGPHNPFPFPDPTPGGSLGAAPQSDPCATRPCISNKVFVSGCNGSGRCGTAALSFREDQHVLLTPAYGFGAGVDFLAGAGQTWGETAGSSMGALCGGAYGLGVYGEVSAGFPGAAPGSAPASNSYGGGFAVGGGAACGAGPAQTIDVTGWDWSWLVG